MPFGLMPIADIEPVQEKVGAAVRQRFYAISVERKVRHPAVVAICEVAQKHIFG